MSVVHDHQLKRDGVDAIDELNGPAEVEEGIARPVLLIPNGCSISLFLHPEKRTSHSGPPKVDAGVV